MLELPFQIGTTGCIKPTTVWLREVRPRVQRTEDGVPQYHAVQSVVGWRHAKNNIHMARLSFDCTTYFAVVCAVATQLASLVEIIRIPLHASRLPNQLQIVMDTMSLEWYDMWRKLCVSRYDQLVACETVWKHVEQDSPAHTRYLLQSRRVQVWHDLVNGIPQGLEAGRCYDFHRHCQLLGLVFLAAPPAESHLLHGLHCQSGHGHWALAKAGFPDALNITCESGPCQPLQVLRRHLQPKRRFVPKSGDHGNGEPVAVPRLQQFCALLVLPFQQSIAQHTLRSHHRLSRAEGLARQQLHVLELRAAPAKSNVQPIGRHAERQRQLIAGPRLLAKRNLEDRDNTKQETNQKLQCETEAS